MKISPPPPRIQTILLAVLAIGIISIAFGDAYGQTADTTDPVITVTHDSRTISINASIPQTESLMEAGSSFYFDLFDATCTDDVDGNIPPNRGGDPDFYVDTYDSSGLLILLPDYIAVGDWVVIFHCVDSAHNDADSVMKTLTIVADNTEPTLTITNPDQSIAFNTDITKSYITNLFGITCTDDESSADYTYTSNPAYDKTTADDYTLTFTCTNGSGLSAPTQTRTLTVLQDTNFPTITINERKSIH